MKATIRCVARPEVAGDPLHEMELRTTLPFIPQTGMFLDFNQGHYVKVDCVWWSSTKPDEIEVSTVEPAREHLLPHASDLLALGWVES